MYTLYTLFFCQKEIHNICSNVYSIQSIMKNKKCVIRVHVFPLFHERTLQPCNVRVYCTYTKRANRESLSEMRGIKLSSSRENAY
jgi:hypothetical protein